MLLAYYVTATDHILCINCIEAEIFISYIAHSLMAQSDLAKVWCTLSANPGLPNKYQRHPDKSLITIQAL